MIHRLTIALLLAVGFAAPAHAAVSFDQSGLNAASDLDNSGDFIAATNFGNNPATVNGIAFSTSSTFGSLSAGWNGGLFGSGITAVSPLTEVLNAFKYQEPSDPDNLVSIQVDNLVNGNPYRVQMLIANTSTTNRTGASPRIEVQGDSFNMTDIGTTPALVTIEFTAAGASETITMGNGSVAQEDRAIINGIAVHLVPEPTSLALLSLGGLVALRRRG